MNILFLCTGNSCRSILSEALFNARAPQSFKSCSAGSLPSGHVHPLTIKTLQSLNIETSNLFSKSMQECQEYHPDIVITVCSSAAQEPCPLYLGQALKVHWGLEDPSHLDLGENEKLQAFHKIVDQINRRFDAFFALNLSDLRDQKTIQLIEKIAEIE